MHLVDGDFLLELVTFFLNVFLLLVTVPGVAHDLVEQLLLLTQLFRQELPAILVIEEVIGSSSLSS